MKGVEDPEFGPTVQKTLQDLSNTEEGNQTVEDLFSSLKDKFVDDRRTSFLPDGQPMQDDKEGIQQADFEVAKTLKMLGEAQKGMAGFEPGKNGRGRREYDRRHDGSVRESGRERGLSRGCRQGDETASFQGSHVGTDKADL